MKTVKELQEAKKKELEEVERKVNYSPTVIFEKK